MACHLKKIITIKFKLNGEVTKETKSARAVIQEAVDRMKFICDKLSADKGECKEVTFIDKYLDSNDNYYDKDVTKWKCGNFVNSTDNDAYTANVTPDHIIGVSPDKYVVTLPLLRSTIGVTRLNFSVRNGKRWNLRAIVT